MSKLMEAWGKYHSCEDPNFREVEMDAAIRVAEAEIASLIRERDEAKADEQTALGLMDAAIDDYNKALRQQPVHRLVDKFCSWLVPNDYDECTIDFLAKENERLIRERDEARQDLELIFISRKRWMDYSLESRNKALDEAMSAVVQCWGLTFAEVRHAILALKDKP